MTLKPFCAAGQAVEPPGERGFETLGVVRGEEARQRGLDYDCLANALSCRIVGEAVHQVGR